MQTMTSEERDLLRALLFEQLDHWHTEHVRSMPIEPWQSEQSYIGAATDAFRGMSWRTLTERCADACRPLQTGIREDWSRRKYVAQVIRSRGRFLRWYAAATLARRPAPRVANDYAAAVVDAGLVDVDSTRFPGIYTVTPRDAIPTWETYPNETPATTPTVPRFVHPGRVITSPALTRADHVALEMGAPYAPVAMVPIGVVNASAADPGAYFPPAYRLIRAATAFFHEHGEHHPAPDVFDVRRRRFHSRPDRVAFRGVARVKVPTAMRYERKITDATPIGIDGQTELRTRLAWWTYCTCNSIARDKCTCVPRGFTGHRATTFARTVRGGRAAAKATRKAAKAATYGPIAGPWSMRADSLRRATASAHADEHAALLESILRTSVEGASITFSNGTIVHVIGAAQVFDDQRGRAFPVREWSRRAALAGIDVE